MEALLISTVFLVLLVLGAPIGTALGVAAVATIFQFDLGIEMLGVNFASGIASFPLLAIPNITSVSVSALFMAGVIPGLLTGAGTVLVAYWVSRRRGYRGSGQRGSAAEIWAALRKSTWALLAPVVILGGIYSGIFTPTEAAVVAVFYSLLVALARGLFAALAIVSITAAAHAVGPEWAGLFSAFPVTMLPLLAIVQFSHPPAQVRTILKNVPRGLGSLLVYVMVVAAAYPTLGAGLGTLLAYAAATAYLVAIEWRHRHRRRGPAALAPKG